MNYQKVKEKNLQFFSGLLDQSSDRHFVVAQSEISHRKRFEKLLELGDFNGRSVLDVGCGIGGFWDFLQEKAIDCDFTGIDINPRMIETARDIHPQIKDKFFVCDIIEEKLHRDYDYIVSNGPLNLLFEGHLNMDMTMRLVRQMFESAFIGAAITMTSSLTRKPNAATFYYKPQDVLAETFKFCSNVRFDHTYLPHDFTLFCYKKSLYDF